MKFPLIDAHCHFFDLDRTNSLPEELSEAKKFGIDHFFCSASFQEEFDWYKKLKSRNFHWYAGIHPNYKKSNINDLPALIKLCEEKKIIAIGEIGLDKRGNSTDEQKKLLKIQLDLAMNFDLPVVFHNVGTYYDLYKILKNDFPKIRGILHSFNASKEIFDHFSSFDIIFSLGCRLPNIISLTEIVKSKRFCFETDAPYQKPMYSKEQTNHLANLLIPFQYVKENFALNEKKLREIQFKNLLDYFPFLGNIVK